MMTRNFTSVQSTLLALVATTLIASCGGDKGQSQGQLGQAGNTPRTYPTMTVSASDIPVENRYPATLKGKLDVEIRPQISGQIIRLLVDEGANVRKGQTLFQIDPVTFREQVNAARAAVQVAESNVATAQLTVENNRQLSEGKVIGAYAMQTSENTLATAQAQLAQAKAQLVAAEKNLSFTNVTSPTDGVVGSIPYRVGSLVNPQMQVPLTTVSNISEMYAYISLSERQLLQIAQGGSSLSSAIAEMPPVSLQLLDGTPYPEKGKVSTVSGVINPTTGSVDVRVLFPNSNGILLSGSTGTVLIPTVIKDGILVPQSSVYEIQERSFVYTVGDNSTVHSQEVTVSDANDGKNYIVEEGLKSGDQIVIDGIITLRDSMQIATQQSQSKSHVATTPKSEQTSQKTI